MLFLRFIINFFRCFDEHECTIPISLNTPKKAWFICFLKDSIEKRSWTWLTQVVDTGVKWGIGVKRGSVKIDLCRTPQLPSSHWLETSRNKSQIHACGFHVYREIHELELRERFLTTSILFSTFSICIVSMTCDFHLQLFLAYAVMLSCYYKVCVVTAACWSLLRQCSCSFWSTCCGVKRRGKMG